MSIQFDLPRMVMLPKTDIVRHDELRIALAGPSKQLLNLWRVQHGFPRSYRDGNNSFCVTAEIEGWLAGQGIKVERM